MSSHSRTARFVNTTQPQHTLLCSTEHTVPFREGRVSLTLGVESHGVGGIVCHKQEEHIATLQSLASQSPCFSTSVDSNPTEHIV